MRWKAAACCKRPRSRASARTPFSLAVRWRRFTFDPQIFRTDSRRSRTKGRENVPLGRRADAREVAYPILWLALDEASLRKRFGIYGLRRRSPSETLAGVPKVALDFLLRPARMTSRQHSGTKLSIRRGKLARRRQTAAAREGADMAVWFIRRLQCLFCEEFTLSCAEIATDAAGVGTPTNDRRDNALPTRERAHALNHGGAID